MQPTDRSLSLLRVVLLLALTAAGCGTAPTARDSAAAPSADESGAPTTESDDVSATCPDTPPEPPDQENDTSGASQLVPTSPEPVLLTVCTYRPDVGGEMTDGSREIIWSSPEAHEVRGEQLVDAVAELNDLPTVRDAPEMPCSLALVPAHRLVVSYADATTVVLDADENCDVVANGQGALRHGITPVIQKVQPA